MYLLLLYLLKRLQNRMKMIESICILQQGRNYNVLSISVK